VSESSTVRQHLEYCYSDFALPALYGFSSIARCIAYPAKMNSKKRSRNTGVGMEPTRRDEANRPHLPTQALKAHPLTLRYLIKACLRPGMFMLDYELRQLEVQLHAYDVALADAGHLTSYDRLNDVIAGWVKRRTRQSMCQGWVALERRYGGSRLSRHGCQWSRRRSDHRVPKSCEFFMVRQRMLETSREILA
jgi:hypothetical protein